MGVGSVPACRYRGTSPVAWRNACEPLTANSYRYHVTPPDINALYMKTALLSPRESVTRELTQTSKPQTTNHKPQTTMSQKITSKNLSYDNSLPPFLARLRGQQTAHSGPDPILAAHRRPGQKRSASEEAEDAPVVLDEDGNVVYLKDGVLDEEGSSSARKDENDKEEPGSDDKEEEEEDGDLAQSKEKAKVAGIGASRKRKVGRVIGEERSDDEREKTRPNKNNDDKARIAKASADVRRLIHQDEDNTTDTHRSTDAVDVKPRKPQRDELPQQKTVKGTKKKAAKKIKLSFGDDDGE
ncbi:hypothetical protein F4782DRAFT_498898 [Xylaria castorea]|nr:hypothetical protein F4782DRAFT_498898 [Xylaria castorea]